MTTEENNQEEVVTPEENEGEGEAQVAENETQNAELIELKKTLEKRDETIGSLKRENKDLKKPKVTPKEEAQQQTDQQSDDTDYARIGYLNSKNVDHPDDQKVVLEEASRLKLSLTDVLNMEHIKTKLKTNQDTREAQDGMPEGKGPKGGPKKGDVAYYLANPDEKSDNLETANKVIDAKMKDIQEGSKFSEVPFVG